MVETDKDNWHELNFPRTVGQIEARRICRYLVVKLEGDCYVELEPSPHYTFGERLPRVKPQSLDEVPLHPGLVDMKGSVSRTDNRASTIGFGFYHAQSRCDRTAYGGMKFSWGAFDWDDMSGQTREFISDIRTKVLGYFETRRK